MSSITDYHSSASEESYSAAWDRAHSAFAAEDAERRAWLDVAAKRTAGKHGKPRETYRPLCECGAPVYCRGLCRYHYDEERKARGQA